MEQPSPGTIAHQLTRRYYDETSLISIQKDLPSLNEGDSRCFRFPVNSDGNYVISPNVSRSPDALSLFFRSCVPTRFASSLVISTEVGRDGKASITLLIPTTTVEN